MLEAAAAIGDGAGEGAAGMAEQLRLDQLLGNRRAVDVDERPAAAARMGVQRARHHLLAGAVLAEDEDPAVGRCRQQHLLAQVLHHRAVADQGVAAVDLGAQVAVLGLERPLAHGVADDQHRLVERQRLLDEVEGAELDGAHRRLDVAVARDDDDLGVDPPLAQPLQGLEPVDARHPHVEQHDVVGVGDDALEARLPGFDGVDGVALVAQHATEGGAHAGLVVDDEDRRHGRSGPVSRATRS